MSTSLTRQEIKALRDVRIHKILGLKDNGMRQAIACPIHNGKNPNFNVYPDNSFFCFKCGVKGSGAIDFCAKLGFSFLEAAEELCKYI